MELFRAKHAAEETLRGSGIAWTIVQATAFMETWGTILGRRLPDSGKILVFGRGDNPINFVSATDVAALLSRAVTSPSLRGQVLQLGGPDNLTFNQFAVILQQATGRRGTIGHVPRSVLRTIALTAGPLKPALARQARAALVMDSLRMTFDLAPTRRALPGLPETALLSALTECWPDRARSRGQG
jgi:NADH dehydrogenase